VSANATTETASSAPTAAEKNEAIAAVPDALVDEVALVGDRARIADRVGVVAR